MSNFNQEETIRVQYFLDAKGLNSAVRNIQNYHAQKGQLNDL